MKMIPDHRQTETVDRRDRRTVDQRCLSLQIRISRICLQHFFDRFPNPFFHLRCRSLGKGHDQKPVHIHRMFPIRQHLDDPFYEDCGFTRSCCRRYKNIPVSQVDHFLLFFCPFYAHACPSFPFLHTSFTKPSPARSDIFCARLQICAITSSRESFSRIRYS